MQLGDLAKMIFGGIGGLIALYLVAANADGIAKVLGSGGNVVTTETKTLQARA